MQSERDEPQPQGGPTNQVRPPRTHAYVLLGVIAMAGIVWLGLAVRPRTIASAQGAHVDSTLAYDTHGYQMGNSDAPVHIIEFGDFECPGCAEFARESEPLVRTQLVASGSVNFRFVDFPLPVHRNASSAHAAAACADAQGKFWEMHDRLFAGQSEWNSEATASPEETFSRYARAIGLDLPKWKQCLRGGHMKSQIAANRADGLRHGVEGTPTVFVNGHRVLPVNYTRIKALVDSIRHGTLLPRTVDHPFTPARQQAE